MKILCTSPRGVEGDLCIACKDAFQTDGETVCCTMAEEQDFDAEKILKECMYAKISQKL